MLDEALPANLKAFAEREFLGERLLWAARPDVGTAFLLSFGIWIFAIPWTAFALFWESAVAGPLLLELFGYRVPGKAPEGFGRTGMWAMALFGLPFVLVGFAMLATPFAVLRKGRRTVYVLTNKRLAILEGGRMVAVTSIRPGEIGAVSRREGPDGRGTLIIDQGFSRDSDGDRVPKKTELGVIPDVRNVERLVLELKAQTT